MSRYDGLIIPRSYSEYINKTDAATLQQALQLPGVLSGAVAAGDNKAVKSSAVNNALTNYVKKSDLESYSSILNPYVSFGAAEGTVYDFMEKLISLGVYKIGKITEISQVTLYDTAFNFTFTDFSEYISTIDSFWRFSGLYESPDPNNIKNIFSIEVITRDRKHYYYKEDRPGYGGSHTWTKLSQSAKEMTIAAGV